MQCSDHRFFAGTSLSPVAAKIVKSRTEAFRLVPQNRSFSISLSTEIRFRQRLVYHAGNGVPQSLASIVKKHDSCRGFPFRQTATIVLWAFARVPHTLDPIEVSPRKSEFSNQGIMSRPATKDGPDLLDPVIQHRVVAGKSGRLWYSSLGIAANFILNWYQDLWKIPSKPGGKLDGLAISFILLQVFVGIPLVP